MYYTRTEETCTGTGNVLTMAGATTKNVAFGTTGNVEDGAVVSCIVEDSGGSILVAGHYVFDKIANTLTRTDKWNYNGTIVDMKPATNIALSAGTHTVRSAQLANEIAPIDRGVAGSLGAYKHLNPPGSFANTPTAGFTMTANTVIFSKYCLPAGITMDALILELSIGVDGSTTRMGISEIAEDGLIGRTLAETASFATGTADTGKKTVLLSSALPVNQSRYVYVWLSSSAAVNVLVHSRNEFATVTGVIDVCDNRGFPYGLLQASAPSAPVIPVPATVTANIGNASLGMLLRYL